MPTGKQLLEHLLYYTEDDDTPLVVVAVWHKPTAPTIMMETVLISRNDILTLVPKPLPVETPPVEEPPTKPPPVVTPPPASPVKMIVSSAIGLKVRKTPGGEEVTPPLKNYDEALVSETQVVGTKTWRKLIAANLVDRAGWICEREDSTVYLAPKV